MYANEELIENNNYIRPDLSVSPMMALGGLDAGLICRFDSSVSRKHRTD
jgi:hypothetical protein